MRDIRNTTNERCRLRTLNFGENHSRKTKRIFAVLIQINGFSCKYDISSINTIINTCTILLLIFCNVIIIQKT